MIHDGVVQWHGNIGALDQTDDAHVLQFITGSATGPIPTLR